MVLRVAERLASGVIPVAAGGPRAGVVAGAAEDDASVADMVAAAILPKVVLRNSLIGAVSITKLR